MIAEVTNGKSEAASWFLDSKIAKSSLISYLAEISTLNIHIFKKKYFWLPHINKTKWEQTVVLWQYNC